jgi:hypothetical protein
VKASQLVCRDRAREERDILIPLDQKEGYQRGLVPLNSTGWRGNGVTERAKGAFHAGYVVLSGI